MRPGPTIALVRPTTLSCQGPALQPPPSPKLSVSPQSSVTIVCNSNGSSTVVCPIVSTSSVMESVAKEVVPHLCLTSYVSLSFFFTTPLVCSFFFHVRLLEATVILDRIAF